MIKTVFLNSLTRAINAFLSLDPASAARVNKLAGKAIAIEFLPFHLHLQCLFSENALQLVANETSDCQATLRGTPLQLLGVMLIKENRQRFFADDLTIEGDAEFGQQVVELFDHLDIDWEEHFSKLVGDIPAYRTSQLIRGVRSWLSHLDEQFTQDVSDYLHEEAHWLPTREALNDFFHEVDDLRLAIDRLEARMKHLHQHLTDEHSRESH